MGKILQFPINDEDIYFIEDPTKKEITEQLKNLEGLHLKVQSLLNTLKQVSLRQSPTKPGDGSGAPPAPAPSPSFLGYNE